MEAPMNCADCPLGDEMDECGCIDWNMDRDVVAIPGPSCPFVLLDARDAEVKMVREHEKRILAESNRLLELTRKKNKEIQLLCSGYIDCFGTSETESVFVCLYCGEESVTYENLRHSPDCILITYTK